ncbi:ribonuclease E [Weizmannia acidilactici]|uniref:Ribonuclease E n=1 Tax=Weizmannia acidilactici TaxID=2607726 RepID=A0A5J4JF06_9BACI|nr:ribonuclease E [Weizmannia acidilactici]GER72138.1 ribonuclease E [Weizmannia acidilactici]
MLSQSIVINFKTREKRYAVLENGEVAAIRIRQPGDVTKVGNIYLGKVAAVKPGINAAFIDIGGGRHGYLHIGRLPAFLHGNDEIRERPISSFLAAGQPIIVQVKKDGTALKGPLLTGIIELAGEQIVYLPEGKYTAVSKKADEAERKLWRSRVRAHLEPREGIILRTAALTGDGKWLDELKTMRKKYRAMVDKASREKAPAVLYEKNNVETEIYRELVRLKSGTVISDDPEILKRLKKLLENHPELDWSLEFYSGQVNIFTYYKIDGALEDALKRIVWLENGAYIVIDETEALISIDVNTGKYTGRQDQDETVLQTNMLAAKEIARQLKLRDYGGMILIDFIDMQDEKEREKVRLALEKELANDGKQTRITGFTELGILQMTRKKTRKSLPETLLKVCPVCKGKGKIESPETVAFRLERELLEMPSGLHEAVLIECTEDVKDCFCGDNLVHLGRLEHLLHVKLFFRIIRDAHPYYAIRQFGTVRELGEKSSSSR